jgi:hypothetical protein
VVPALVLIAAAGVATAVAAVFRSPLRPGRYVVRRVPESHAPLMSARLIPSHRAIAGRPSAASTASPAHVITDVPWRNPAPGRTERSQ